jgi:hypothetical protein
MNIFLMAYKVRSVLSVYALVVFKILFVFLAKKIKYQVFTCFFENIFHFLNPSNNPLQRACGGIQKPAYYCEACSGTRL